MAGIHQTETIDVVAKAADGSYLLVMIETRPWGSDPAQTEQLQAKINTYAQFALDGALIRHYPDAANKPIAIQLDCATPAPRDVTSIVDHAKQQLQRFGIDVRLNVNPRL
jgi:hypothetical protein